jgi:hypothetical protein
MPGHNHYSRCTCGWCVKQRGGSIQPFNLRVMDAVKFLDNSRVRSLRQCYVNPNAICPVCGTGVYFYANRFGSRVFFDELGPPWPKHPCTDNPRRRADFHAESRPRPSRRARGSAMELVEAASLSGMAIGKLFGQRRRDEWSPAVVISVERKGDENRVVAEHLDSNDYERFSFTCFSEDPVLAEGDLLSVRGLEVSFVHPDTLETVIVRSGARIVPQRPDLPPPRSQPATQTSKMPPVPIVASTAVARGFVIAPKDLLHFGRTDAEREAFVDKMTSTLQLLDSAGRRRPKLVAARLNQMDAKTAIGADWNRRLVKFLQRLIHQRRKPNSTTPRQPQPSVARRAAEQAESPSGDLAEKLSMFGRVSMRRRRDVD